MVMQRIELHIRESLVVNCLLRENASTLRTNYKVL